MRHLLGVGTDRGYAMIGTGIGVGLSEFRSAFSGFSPAKVSNLLAWWDASDVSTLYQSSGGSLVAADGDPVGQWQDKSGNGFHWEQATGITKPAYRTGIKNTRPIVRFDGVNDNMTIAGSTSTMKAMHTGNSSVFVVFNASSLASTRFIYDNTNGSGSNIGSYLRANTNGSFQRFVCAGAANGAVENISSASAVVAGSWYVTGIVTKPADATAADRDKIYKNGGAAIANNAQTQAPSASNATAVYTLGSTSSPGSYFVGDIAELIFYSAAVSDADRDQIVAYLNAKWSVY